MKLIYGLHIGDNVIRYVGQTNDAVRRLKEHRYFASRLNYPVYKWMRKYGVNNIQMVVIEICLETDDVTDREQFWIDQYTGLLNVAQAGQPPMTGRNHTAATTAKISVSRRGKGGFNQQHTPESKAKMSASKKGKPWSPARRAAQEAKQREKGQTN